MVGRARHFDHPDPPAGEGIPLTEWPPGWVGFAMSIDPDRVLRFHPVTVGGDALVGRRNDVLRRPVVLDQVMHLGVVIALESADELDIRPPETVDALVIVSHGQNRKLLFRIRQRPARDRTDQVVLRFVDVLVFVHQDMLKTAQEPVAHFVGLDPARHHRAAQHRRRLGDQRVQVRRHRSPGAGQRPSQQPQGQAMVRLDHDPAGIGAGQIRQPPPQLDGRLPVETADQDPPGPHPFHAQQVGTPMHHRPGLARTRSRQDQQVPLNRRGDDFDLSRMIQLGDDPLIGTRGGGMLEQLRLVTQKPPHKGLLVHREIGQHQLQRLADPVEPAPGVFAHHVHLQHPFLVVMPQRLIVRDLIAFASGLGLQPDGHRRTEDRQPLLQHDHVLLMQVHQRPFECRIHIFQFGSQPEIALDGGVQLFEREFDQQIRLRPGLGRDLAQQHLEYEACHLAPSLRQFAQRRPGPAQPDPVQVAAHEPQLETAMRSGEPAPILAQAFQ